MVIMVIKTITTVKITSTIASCYWKLTVLLSIIITSTTDRPTLTIKEELIIVPTKGYATPTYNTTIMPKVEFTITTNDLITIQING